jgi:Amt family ammonium transporter
MNTDELNTVIDTVSEALGGEAFGIWFLLGAVLVFFMQCGFAMVETGFTRAKNAGNIIMKNLMDFCIGTAVFMPLGFGLIYGKDIGGFIGTPTLSLFTNWESFDYSSFFFNLVFCATTATIVSGAMAERTKFVSYCLYSGILSAVIYPIEAHWAWGGGWLTVERFGTTFHDFAGSALIHMVGGLSALIGAAILGPRLGKYKRDKDGKVTQVNAFPGHSLTLGALGVFILWFAWYGFNGAAATTVDQLASILVTTTIAPAVATLVCMIFTWTRFGKPDVSMCLNASLAGLVAITAGCDIVDGLGATVIGAVAGILVVFGVWFVDNVLHIDDPVGAVAVHGFNGLWGGLACGLFDTTTGVFYGGGFGQLAYQFIGIVAILAWTAVTITITFLAIKHTIGLRASKEEEIKGLDICEHGLMSAYDGFVFAHETIEYDPAEIDGIEDLDTAIEVKNYAVEKDNPNKLTKIVTVFNEQKLGELIAAMESIAVTGMTVTNVQGCGTQKGQTHYYRGAKVTPKLLPKVKTEVVVSKVPVNTVVNTIKKTLYTGHIGDGKIFIYDVEDVVKVRTGAQGYDALQDEN